MENIKLENRALNAICPYFTMFPLNFPYDVLCQNATIGDVVIDPFCGRGTTVFASRLLGLQSIGIDSSPVAVAISEAKLADVEPVKIIETAVSVLGEISNAQDVPEGDFWKLAYHKDVLDQICRLRDGLRNDCSTDARRALRAIVLGALHGPRNKIVPSYFSNQSPRTYAPKPNYAVRYWKAKNLLPEKVNVLEIIASRAKRYFNDLCQSLKESKIILGDSRNGETFDSLRLEKNIRWVITSPPYYGMRTYIPDQWLRNWFVGGPSEVDYSSRNQVLHSSPEVFASELRAVWKHLANVCSKESKMIVRFGGINDRKAEPLEIIRESYRGSGWDIKEVVPAGTASKGRRQAENFLSNSKKPLEEYDIWAEV